MKAAFLVLALFAAVALSQVKYKGVSEAGPEFVSTAWPKQASIKYFVDRGANIIRFPFRWDRAQPTLGGALDSGYWGQLQTLVNYATSLGAVAILDNHNYARYPYNDNSDNNACKGGGIIGKNSAATLDNFENFWNLAAASFANSPNKGLVWYGLMNEPCSDSTEAAPGYTTFIPQQAYNLAARGLKGVRAGGGTGTVLVAGTAWTGAASWLQNWYDKVNSQSNGALFQSGFTDPLNNYAVELHVYFDADYSGTKIACKNLAVPSPSDPNATWDSATVLDALTAWGTQYSQKLFLGEFGFGQNTNCYADANQLLSYLDARGVVGNKGPWLGWTYWAAGPAWGSDYTNAYAGGYSVEPDFYQDSNGNWQTTDHPQYTNVLKNFLTAGSVSPPSSSSSTTTGSSTTGSSSTGSSGSCTNPAVAANAQCGNAAGYPLAQGSTPPSSFSCCPSGYSCQFDNPYWWKCVATTSSSSGSTSGSSTSGSSTSGSSTSGGSGGACIPNWAQCGTNSPFDGSYASSASAGCCTQPGYQGTGVYKGCSQPGGTGYWQCKPS